MDCKQKPQLEGGFGPRSLCPNDGTPGGGGATPDDGAAGPLLLLHHDPLHGPVVTEQVLDSGLGAGRCKRAGNLAS